MRSVVLLSGGLDSCACLFQELEAGYDVTALYVAYGQRHAVEVTAARVIAAMAGVRLVETTVTLAWAASALTGGGDSPVVPMRNTILASVAAGYASSIGADSVVMGACLEDADLFPDCRPEFMEALTACTELSLGVAVRTPLIKTSKTDTLRWLHAWPVAMAAAKASWSCYDPQSAGARAPFACGKCLACVTRQEAFAEVGIDDPGRR